MKLKKDICICLGNSKCKELYANAIDILKPMKRSSLFACLGLWAKPPMDNVRITQTQLPLFYDKITINSIYIFFVFLFYLLCSLVLYK